MTRPLIYTAAPFGGDQAKLARAEAWVAYLCGHFDALFWAPWISLCRHWPDCGVSRKRGLELDLDAVRRSDGIILVGGELSAGMQVELDHAGRNAVSIWNASEFATPEQLAESGNGYEFDAIAGWVRGLQMGGDQ